MTGVCTPVRVLRGRRLQAGGTQAVCRAPQGVRVRCRAALGVVLAVEGGVVWIRGPGAGR